MFLSFLRFHSTGAVLRPVLPFSLPGSYSFRKQMNTHPHFFHQVLKSFISGNAGLASPVNTVLLMTCNPLTGVLWENCITKVIIKHQDNRVLHKKLWNKLKRQITIFCEGEKTKKSQTLYHGKLLRNNWVIFVCAINILLNKSLLYVHSIESNQAIEPVW